MSKRHDFKLGDWQSIAFRLDEIISAHSGEDPFEEALKLLVGKLVHEATGKGEFIGRASRARELNRLLGAASERWRGTIEVGATTHLNETELGRCASVLDGVRLLDEDLVGLDAIFEAIVSKTSKGEKGQYFTPRHVIAEVVAMMRPVDGERVADPACGSGGFLRHALRANPKCSVWGFDHDARAVRLARVMIAASGRSTHVMRVDSLRRAGGRLFSDTKTPVIEDLVRAQDPKFRGFDVILTNPPFAGDVGREYAAEYELGRDRRVERDVLFVERCVELLRPGGRIAIVLPHNKVGSAAWSFMRAWLLQRVQVVAVLGLGRNTFQPHTGQKACVVIGRKRAAQASDTDRREEILFFISERDGKDHRGRLLLRTDGGVDHDLALATPLVRDRFAHLAGGA